MSFKNPYLMIKDEVLGEDFQIKEKKYYDISVTYGPDDGDGYSIFVEGFLDENEAVPYAAKLNLFQEPEDVNSINYVDEITREEYENWSGKRAPDYDAFLQYKGWRIFEEDGKFTFGSKENSDFRDCSLENCLGVEDIMVDLCLKMGVHMDFYSFRQDEVKTCKDYLDHFKEYDSDTEFIVPTAVFDKVSDVKAYLDAYEKESDLYFKAENLLQRNENKYEQSFTLYYSVNNETKTFNKTYDNNSRLNIHSFANNAADYFSENYSGKEKEDVINSISGIDIVTEKNGEWADTDCIEFEEDILEFIQEVKEFLPQKSEKDRIYVEKMIGGELCQCENVNNSGKMRFELEGTFDGDVTRKTYMIIPIELSENALEDISGLWLSEQEKELGLEIGSSCTSSSWWAGSDNSKNDELITAKYDYLVNKALAIAPVIPDIHGMHLYNLEGHVFGEMAGYITGKLSVDDYSLDILFRVKDDTNGEPMKLVSVDCGYLHPEVKEHWNAIEHVLKNHAENWCKKLDVLLDDNKLKLSKKTLEDKIRSAENKAKGKKSYGILKKDMDR